jgi:hypothetical protein
MPSLYREMELGLRTQIASALKEEKWIFLFLSKAPLNKPPLVNVPKSLHQSIERHLCRCGPNRIDENGCENAGRNENCAMKSMKMIGHKSKS